MKKKPHHTRAPGARASYPGVKLGKLTFGEIIQFPDYYQCKCDCGREVVMRASVAARRIKGDLPIDCGVCGDPVKKRRVREKRMMSRRNAGGSREIIPDLPYIPPPPCEVDGICKFFDTCNAHLLACQDLYKYAQGGTNVRTGCDPNADFFSLIYPGVREMEKK